MIRSPMTLAAAILGIACCPSFSRAQEAPEVTLQFVSFPKSTAPEPVELLLGGGKSIQVKIPSNTLSDPYKVPALSAWAVGKMEPGKEEGTMVFNSYGQAPSIASRSQLIILVRKGRENAEGMEVIPIDNELANFGGGSFLFMNTTTVDIAGECGDEKFAIKPDKRALIRPLAKDGAKQFHAVFYFRKGDEAKPFFSSKWPINDKARSLVFFYHDPHNQRIRMHTIRKFLP